MWANVHECSTFCFCLTFEVSRTTDWCSKLFSFTFLSQNVWLTFRHYAVFSVRWHFYVTWATNWWFLWHKQKQGRPAKHSRACPQPNSRSSHVATDAAASTFAASIHCYRIWFITCEASSQRGCCPRLLKVVLYWRNHARINMRHVYFRDRPRMFHSTPVLPMTKNFPSLRERGSKLSCHKLARVWWFSFHVWRGVKEVTNFWKVTSTTQIWSFSDKVHFQGTGVAAVWSSTSRPFQEMKTTRWVRFFSASRKFRWVHSYGEPRRLNCEAFFDQTTRCLLSWRLTFLVVSFASGSLNHLEAEESIFMRSQLIRLDEFSEEFASSTCSRI